MADRGYLPCASDQFETETVVVHCIGMFACDMMSTLTSSMSM